MKTLFAFFKKEWMEQIRSGRFVLLGILFVLLGIMNPAIAKLTPWLLSAMADALAESGMTVSAVSVDAMTSWTQFFKNIPMGLIAFVLLESGIFTKEYQSGTLVLTLTKGLKRRNVVLAKAAVLALLWSACYWLCFVITYGYNAYFWDNGAACHLLFAVTLWWLLGLWTLTVMVLFSAAMTANTGVLAAAGGVFLAAYLIGLFPKCSPFMPTKLMDAAPLLAGAAQPESYTKAILVALLSGGAAMIVSIPVMDRRRL